MRHKLPLILNLNSRLLSLILWMMTTFAQAPNRAARGGDFKSTCTTLQKP